MPINNALLIAADDPILLALPKRINWAWIRYSCCAEVALPQAQEALLRFAPDAVIACVHAPEREALTGLLQQACPTAKVAWVDAQGYLTDPEGSVGRLLETLKQIAAQISDEQSTLLNSAFVTSRAQELSGRLVQLVSSGDYENLRHTLSAYIELVVARSNGSDQFIYVKTVELILLAGYKPMQYRTCFDRMLEGDFCKKLQQVISQRSTLAIDKFLYHAICDSIAAGAVSSADQGGAAIFERAINYIGTNFHKRITLEEVAHMTYMSPSYFSNSFHQRMGITFSEYLVILRMNKAKELLTTTGLRIYEVAERSGYEDFRHFSKMFKKHTHCSPAEYRKQHVEKERLP